MKYLQIFELKSLRVLRVLRGEIFRLIVMLPQSRASPGLARGRRRKTT